MNSLTSTLTPAALMLIPIVAGIIQILKNEATVIQPYKAYLPFVSLILGIGLAVVSHITNPVVAGLIIGLAATGSYETLKQ